MTLRDLHDFVGMVPRKASLDLGAVVERLDGEVLHRGNCGSPRPPSNDHGDGVYFPGGGRPFGDHVHRQRQHGADIRDIGRQHERIAGFGQFPELGNVLFSDP